MYGALKLNQSKVFTADSFEIVNDPDGLFSFIFRLSDNAIKLQNLDPAAFASLSDSPMQQKWIQLLQRTQNGQTIDAGTILNYLD